MRSSSQGRCFFLFRTTWSESVGALCFCVGRNVKFLEQCDAKMKLLVTHTGVHFFLVLCCIFLRTCCTLHYVNVTTALLINPTLVQINPTDVRFVAVFSFWETCEYSSLFKTSSPRSGGGLSLRCLVFELRKTCLHRGAPVRSLAQCVFQKEATALASRKSSSKPLLRLRIKVASVIIEEQAKVMSVYIRPAYSPVCS